MKLFLLSLLFPLCALAGLPPTATKGSSDSTYATTFKFNFPNIAITHAGSTATFGVVGVSGGGTGTGTTFTQGSVLYVGSAGAYSQDNSHLYYDSTNAFLGIGTAAPKSILHVNGNFQQKVSTLTSNTSLDNTTVIMGDATSGTFTVSLPDCVSNIFGREYHIKKIDSSANSVTIGIVSDDTIDGLTSYSMTTQYASISVVCVSATLWGIF